MLQAIAFKESYASEDGHDISKRISKPFVLLMLLLYLVRACWHKHKAISQSVSTSCLIGCRLTGTELTHKKTTLYAVIVNTFHFNVNRRKNSILSLNAPVYRKPSCFENCTPK